MFLESFFISSRLSNLFTACSYGFFCAPFSLCFFGSLSFLLGESDHRAVSCVHPLKEPALGLIDLFLLFLNLCFLHFLPDLYYFFPSVDARFCLSFFFEPFPVVG